MTPKFLTNTEAQKRIAELEAQVKAATSGTVRNIADDEALLAQMKADRLKREAAKGATNAAPTPAAVRDAVAARLEAGKAALAAAEAKARAKQAAAALQPVATTTAAAYLASIARPTMTREEFSKVPHAKRGEVIKAIVLIP